MYEESRFVGIHHGERGLGKDKKDKSEQNQSKPTRNGKDKKKSEDGKPNQSKAGSARYSKSMKTEMKITQIIPITLPQPEYQTYSCESCGNDAHYGYPCPSFVPDPCYNRNFDCFPHDSQTLPQQYQTPPVTSMKMLHAQTDLIEAMQDFLKKYDHIPHNEKSIKLLLAEEKFLKIKQVVEEEQTQPEYLQELLQSLLNDLQILNEIQPLRQELLSNHKDKKK
ncbi:hypothetical protein Tco_0624836 [Tanacetum coccineum]|uniref:CCHC-type domain-containing protein n=1 Tax=Tanacetum coccineum TaxID=301880 RepID=A0ABQ4WF22_9ASTR